MRNAQGNCRSAAVMLAAISMILAASATPAQILITPLGSFSGTNGAFSYGAVVQGLDGNLYGTTIAGGSYNDCFAEGYVGCGTIYKMTPEGELTTLYAFCSQPNCADGAGPVVGLVLGSDGNFYGTTLNGGTSARGGTVFRITPEGVLTTLHSFCVPPSCYDGPGQALIQGRDGSLYGTTSGSGILQFGGTIFRLTLGGTFTILYSFDDTDGYNPDALVQGADGSFFGTTFQGGAYNGGTLFVMSPAGTVKTLYDFCPVSGCPDGSAPAGLIQAGDGNFYGYTVYGGSFNQGTVFRITPGGTLTSLYSFGQGDAGIFPSSLIRGTDGKLYGTTNSGGYVSAGTVFRMSLNGTEQTLGVFDGYDGQYPSGLTQDTNGKFYGTAISGGRYSDGTVFSLNTALPPFISLLPQSAPVGRQVAILGGALIGATSVTFNGTPASFTVSRTSTFIKATVPVGATTGPVQVVTPSGTLTSNVNFQVLP